MIKPNVEQHYNALTGQIQEIRSLLIEDGYQEVNSIIEKLTALQTKVDGIFIGLMMLGVGQ